MKVTITRNGMRAALDKVCLYLLPLMGFSITFVLLGSTGDKGPNGIRTLLVPTILGLGIMAGLVATAYVTLTVGLSFLTRKDKNAPLPFGAEDWARTRTADERKAQLNRESLRFIGLGALALCLGLISLALIATAQVEGAAITFVSALVLSITSMKMIKRSEARETAHMRLKRAEKAA